MLDAEQFRLEVFDAVPKEVPAGAVHGAIEEFERQGRTQAWQVAECVTRARQLVAQVRLEEPAQTLALASTPESEVQTAALRRMLAPWVHDVRRELFGRPGRPFTSAHAAVRWIEASAARRTIARRKRMKARYDRLMARVRPELAGLERLTGNEWRLQEVVLTLSYQRPRQASVTHIGVARGSRLMALKQAASGMAGASGFAEDAVVSWILVGHAPVLGPARLLTRIHRRTLPDGTAMIRREASVELNVRDLSYQKFRGIYRAIRATWEVTRVKGWTRRDVKLKEAVDRRGGLPQRHPWSKGFWQPVADGLGFPTYMAALMAYRRLVKRLARL